MLDVPRRLNHCILDEKVFKPGDTYISCLDPDKNRKDYCLACWEKEGKPKEKHTWKGKIPDRKEKYTVSDEKLLSWLRALKDPKYRFIFVLYLQRKKQLVQRTKTLYEVPETGEVFDVEIVPITKEESQQIAEELAERVDFISKSTQLMGNDVH